MRVGFVNYINALPLAQAFVEGHLESKARLVLEIPSVLNGLLRREKLDVSLVSSAEYLDGNYALLPNYGIAAEKKILSVNLYVKKHLPTLHQSRLGLTHHSATSIALLKVLCFHFWKVAPRFESLDRTKPYKEYDGFLLIGDEALQQREIPGFQTIDLASAWYEATALPFIFAVFAVRKDYLKNNEEKVLGFQTQLQRSLSWSEKHWDKVEERAQKQCKLDTPIIRDYYALCRYKIGERELRGLQIFADLRRKIDA